MAHDVFISYASQDKPAADALCAAIEGRGVRCWIAPRDAISGIPYPEQLIDAIQGSRVFVLIFSSSSNRSPQVMREVERAVHRGIPIVPLRLEDVPMSKNMEFFISTPHWLDALTPPLDRHLQHMADTVQVLLKRPEESPESPRPEGESPRARSESPQALPMPSAAPPKKRTAILLAAAAAAIVLAFLAIRLLSHGARTDRSLDGAWGLAFQKDGVDWSLVWEIAGGDYRVRTTTADAGTFRGDASRWRTVSRGGQVASGTWFAGPGTVTMQGGPLGTVTWRRQGGDATAGMAGTWVTTVPIGGLDWELVSENRPNGSYTLRGSTEDFGTIESRDGRFKTVSKKTGVTTEGTYSLVGADRLSTTAAHGTAVWSRAGR